MLAWHAKTSWGQAVSVRPVTLRTGPSCSGGHSSQLGWARRSLLTSFLVSVTNGEWLPVQGGPTLNDSPVKAGFSCPLALMLNPSGKRVIFFWNAQCPERNSKSSQLI